MSLVGQIFRAGELRRRLLFTLGMLAVYRVGIFVTTPGVDRNVMRKIVQDQSGTFLGMFNLFSGGALEQLSIFALGIMPYVSASIILQLMGVVFQPLAELRKEGEAGQRKINQYTRYGTVLISLFQAFGLSYVLEGLNAQSQFGSVVVDAGPMFRLLTVVSLTTGTCFLMWLGEQIQEKGIGNGISLIIFAGIVADLPSGMRQLYSQMVIGEIQPVTMLAVVFIVLILVAVVVFFERGQRRLPIQYARRSAGTGVTTGGQVSHLPLKVNASGVIPPIFASSLLMFPMTLQNIDVPGMSWLLELLVPGNWAYTFVFGGLIIFFCFFYTAVTFQPVEVAENLKKQGAFVPGLRPGKATAEYIDYVVTRLTAGGALYVAAVCVLPTLVQSELRVPFYLGGTSLMIVVGVALDTVQQAEAHLITQRYENIGGRSAERRLSGRKADA